ncbi:uncharacterized protein LOC129796415 [Lutzomyia longipalpis]|uniref:Putative neuropeptide-like protein 31 n=1 Tax=Lutzomyia longipalpis TaxID=7200 RepID=A0A1B0CNG4_LUTLO|nr:uncharacterized protein LOC129796415 [Lutzomyia longipalpis]
MKGIISLFFALFVVVYSIPVLEENPQKSVVKLSPVEVSEDNAEEEGVDLQPAEQFYIGLASPFGGPGGPYGGYGYGGYGGYRGYGFRRHGWGGHSHSFSSSSSSSQQYWG